MEGRKDSRQLAQDCGTMILVYFNWSSTLQDVVHMHHWEADHRANCQIIQTTACRLTVKAAPDWPHPDPGFSLSFPSFSRSIDVYLTVFLIAIRCVICTSETVLPCPTLRCPDISYWGIWDQRPERPPLGLEWCAHRRQREQKDGEEDWHMRVIRDDDTVCLHQSHRMQSPRSTVSDRSHSKKYVANTWGVYSLLLVYLLHMLCSLNSIWEITIENPVERP